MDLNDYWQENKRFVLIVISGLILFMIGEMLIGAFISGDLKNARGSLNTIQRELRQSRYVAKDLTQARQENDALVAAKQTLAEAVAFQPRPGFVLDSALGSAGNQYFAQVTRVREDLLRRAGREGVRIAPDLGLPALAPTREIEIVRYLEALDLIERVLDLAIEVGVDRVNEIQIKLDPKLLGRDGVGRVERTRVEMKMSGSSLPLQRLAVATQSPSRGPSILIEKNEIVPERMKTDEVKLNITFIAPRLTVINDSEGN